MKSCAFFGHRQIEIKQYREKLISIITDLIENKGVTQFYSGGRGTFDSYCCELVHGLKEKYPQITVTKVLSYIPASTDPDYVFTIPKFYDDSIYLLERRVPQRVAIVETNKCLADRADYIVAGIELPWGGAYKACEYAMKRKKPIINVIDNDIFKSE